jgi:hypothetical protein
VKLEVEEALRRAEHAAAFASYAADAAVKADEAPSAEALSGMADMLAEVETIARVVRKALPIEALGIEVDLEQEKDSE